MIGMNVEDIESDLREYAKEHGFIWPQVALGPHSQIAADYGIRQVPKFIVIDRDGKVALKSKKDWNEFKAGALKVLDMGNR